MITPSIKYLDKLWVEIIRLMFCEKCAKCGRTGCDAHHVIMRSDHRHRWHPLNGVFLCLEDHDWAHTNQSEFLEWLRENLPDIYFHGVQEGFDPHSRTEIKSVLKATHALLTKQSKGFLFIPQTHE